MQVKSDISDSGISDTDEEFEYEYDINCYFNTKIQLNMGRPAKPEEIAPDDEVIYQLNLNKKNNYVGNFLPLIKNAGKSAFKLQVWL